LGSDEELTAGEEEVEAARQERCRPHKERAAAILLYEARLADSRQMSRTCMGLGRQDICCCEEEEEEEEEEEGRVS